MARDRLLPAASTAMAKKTGLMMVLIRTPYPSACHRVASMGRFILLARICSGVARSWPDSWKVVEQDKVAPGRRSLSMFVALEEDPLMAGD